MATHQTCHILPDRLYFELLGMTGNEAFLPAVIPSVDNQSPLLTGFETDTWLGIRQISPLGLSLESDALTLDETASALEQSETELVIPVTDRADRLNTLFQSSPIFIPQYNRAQLLTGDTDELTGQVNKAPISNPILEGLKGSVDPLYGDADGDDDVDNDDLQVILEARNEIVTNPDDRRDLDNDGRITTLDARKLIIHLQGNQDFAVPDINASLVRDTAPGNKTNSDGITFDLGIAGNALDESLITRLQAGINDMPVGHFVDILGARQADGSFSLNRQQLEAIYGSPMVDGEYRLKLWAKDQWANRTGVEEVVFTLDTVAPPLTLGLDPESDTGVQGDLTTESASVTLVGQTEASLIVTLVQTGETAIADASGQYVFSDVVLEEGDNSFTVITADIAGNETGTTQTITRVVLNTPPTVDSDKSLTVDEDSGPTSLAIGIPEDAEDDSLTITVTSLPEVDKGTIQQADGTPLTVGKVITAQELTELAFLPVDDESGEAGAFSYTVDDGHGNTVSQAVTITITSINDGPSIVVPEASSVESGAELSFAGITVRDIDAETRDLTVTISATNGVLSLGTVDGVVFVAGDGVDDGTIIFTGTLDTINNVLDSLIYRSNKDFSGSDRVSLVVNDQGNSGIGGAQSATAAIDVVVTQSFTETILLAEETRFKTTESLPITIPAGISKLRFTYQTPSFDTTTPDAINDSFEVALLDADGNSLVHTLSSSQDVFFNHTEGEVVAGATGVTVTVAPIETEVILELPDVPSDTEATLVFRLVNNDGDTETTVVVNTVSLVPGEENSHLRPAGNSLINNIPSPLTSERASQMSDVSASVVSDYGQTSFNQETQVLSTEMVLENVGTYSINGPLAVGIANLSDPQVQVVNVDGVTQYGLPYYIVEPDSTGMLVPNGRTSAQLLTFQNLPEGQFTYDLVVLANTNDLPVIESSPDLEIIGGQTYIYDVLATDPNDDTLTYELIVAPEGMTIDSNTGEITWETALEDIANHSITLRVSDGRGGSVEQTYTLAVIAEPSNRPPIFTSTPVVDAHINQPYRYDADAIDPDQDPVEYTLVRGPEGLTVDAETGVVAWTPPPILSLGDTVLGQISLPGDQAEFTVSGVVGQRLYLDSLRTFSGFSIEVYDPDGRQIDTGDGLFTLTKNGNYRVVAGGSGAATGSYGFSVIDPALLPEAPLDTQITGQLAPGTEDDVFRFSGVKGQKIFFDQLRKQGSLEWMLFDEGNRIIKQDRSMNDIEMYLPVDGEYILVLRGSSDFAEVVEYAFEIVTPDEITAPMKLGSNNVPNEITGEISEPGEEDFFTFTGVKGQRIYLDRLNTIDNGNVSVTVTGPDDQLIVGYYDRRGNLIGRTFDSSHEAAPITLTAEGTYQVRIDGTGDKTGGYGFSLRDLGLATEINVDQTYSNSLTPGEVSHLYQFEVSAGQRIFIDYQDNSTEVYRSRTQWKVYDSSNKLIESGYTGGYIETVLENAGIYTLAIDGDREEIPVDYSFEIITPETVAQVIELNTPIAGNIVEKGEQDILTFEGSKGQRIFLDVLLGSNHRLDLVTPSKNKLLDNIYLVSSELEEHRPPLILPENGTYQIRIDGTGGNTGEYKFQVLNVDNGPTLTSGVPVTDTLIPGNSIQFYQFEGVEGDRIYLDKNTSSQQLISYVYGPKGQRLSRTYFSRSRNILDQEIVLPGDGTYFWMLRGESTEPIDYTIKVVSTNVVSEPVAVNDVVTGAISELGKQTIYHFDATVGQQLLFDSLTGGGNISVEIKNPSGNIVFNGNLNGDSSPLLILDPGTYELKIDGSKATIGDYRFAIRDAAASLTLQTPYSGTLATKETILYTFDGNSGQRIGFNNLTTDTVGHWTLYTPDGQLIQSSNLRSDFDSILTADGPHILVLQNNTDSDLSYSFQLSDISPALVPQTGIGEIYNGEIAVLNEVDTYSFSANVGTLLYLDGIEGARNLRVSVYQPDGRNLFFSVPVANNRGPFYLKQTGDYRLEVNGVSSTTGNYAFKLLDVNTAATNIAFDTITQVSLPPQQSNIYKFVGKPGQQILLDGLDSSDIGVTVRLIDSTGRQITSTNTTSNSGLKTLTLNGDYYLLIESQSDEIATANFRILDAANALPLALDTQVSGDLGTGYETVLYTFTGSEAQKLFVDRTVGGTSTGWTGRSLNKYAVYSADGKQIFETDLLYDYELVSLPKDGQYILAISGNGDANKDYELQIVTPTDVVSTIEFGAVIEGEITEAGQTHTYTFTGTENQRVIFDGLSQVDAFNIISAQVYSPSGHQLINDDFRFSDPGAVTLSENGTYRIVIDAIGERTLPYSFRLLDFADATEISLDAPFSGDLGDDKLETQIYRFTGAKDQRIYFDRLTGNSWNNYVLYAPDGRQISSKYLNEEQLVQLPVDGEYVVAFVGVGQNGSNYGFNLVTPEWDDSTYTIGDIINGEISEAGEEDTYTFIGEPGQILWFDTLPASTLDNIVVTLRDPNGHQVWSVASNREYIFSEPIILSNAGQYTLTVDGYWDTVGSYAFRFLDFAEATPVALDTPVTGNFGSNESETTIYQLDVESGQRLYFREKLGGNETQGFYHLYNASGERVFYSQLSDTDQSGTEIKESSRYFLVFSGNGAAGYEFEVVTPEFISTAYTLGESIQETISEKGEQDWYTFSGRVGQQLYLDGLSGDNRYVSVKIYAPSGEKIVDSSSSRGISDAQKMFQLEEAGEYRIVVDGSGGNFDDYGFRLLDTDAVAEVLPGETISGTLGENGRETHLYKLSGNAGERLYIDPTVGSIYNRYHLYQPDGSTLFNNSSLDKDTDIVLPATGEYLLVIEGSGNSYNPYEIILTTPSVNTMPVVVGSLTAGELTERGQQDNYTFAGTVGQRIYLKTFGNDSGLNLRLYGPHGEQVTRLESNEQIITLTKTGDYRLVVDGIPNRRFVTERNTGSYSFVLDGVPQREELTFDQAISGNVDTTHLVRLYQFTGEQGSRIQLDLEAETWTGASWALYDSGNQVIAKPSVDNPDIDVVLPATGQYLLAIQQTGDEPIAYSFQASNTAVTDIENNGFGVVRQGSIDQGDQVDRYTFTAKAGTQVLFDSLLNSQSNIRWNLVNPDKTVSITNSYVGFDRQPGDFELNQTGEYTLEVYSVNGQPAGSYSFNLMELPNSVSDTSYNPLDVNLVTEGQLTTEQPTQVYSFNAAVGQKIHFNNLQSSNVVIQLYSPNGETINSRFDNVLYSLDQAGVYNLVVKTQNSGLANYKFQLLTTSEEGTTEYNRSYSGTLTEPREKRIYSFNGEAGQTFFFDGRTTVNFGVTLYGPDGKGIASDSRGRDFETALSDDGVYQLVLQSSSSSAADYEFSVFSYDEQTVRDSITPGTGEDSTSDGENSLGSFAVRIAAEDDQGATTFQDYQIQVLPDPDNDAPVIVSQPSNIHGFNQGIYRYQVNALDPNGDELFYRLIDSPLGAVIDNETGELFWSPTVEAIDQSFDFTIEVDDRRGGTTQQIFTVDVYDALGTIQGFVFDDLNGNGLPDSSVLQGDNPDAFFVIDTSGSMGGKNINWLTTELEDALKVHMSPLDQQLAAILASAEFAIEQGRGNTTQLAVFTSGGVTLDMNPALPGIQVSTTALADANDNGISDIREAVHSFAGGGGSNTAGIAGAWEIQQALPGESNIIFMSDGYISVNTELIADVKADGVNILSVGFTPDGMTTMRLVDEDAVLIRNPQEIVDIFSGFDPRFISDPLMASTVYLDLNNNGVLDDEEPSQLAEIRDSQITSAFEFSNLLPGDYTLRQVTPNGYMRTAPASGSFQEIITVGGGERITRFFGNQEIAPVPNSNPFFTSEIPTETLTANRLFRYDANAIDADADLLQYDLTSAPDGMDVDPDTGDVVWIPGAGQSGKNTAILRVRDGEGGVAIQYLELNVAEPNQAPVFTSVFDEENLAQVGKPFQYQATAIDTDGDPIIYSLTGDVPANISIASSTGVVSWTPTQEQPGAHEITVVAQDDKGAQDIQTLILNVVEPQPNREPVITSQARTVARYETPYLYQVTVDDPDNDVLSFSLVDGPEGMTINESGLVQWLPTVEANGNHMVTVAVNDGQGGEDQQTFTLTVRHQAANVGPSITSEPLTLTNIERPYTYQAEATDPDGDPILWSLTEAPEGMVIDPNSGRLSWQPGLTQVGDHEITLQASDTLGAFSSQTFTVQVRSTNTPPQILSTPPTDIGIEQPYRYSVEAQDPEGDALSYGLGAHPEGMTINSETGELVWTPAEAGSHEVEVWVRDSQDGVGRQTYTLVVSRESVNQAPMITSNPGFWADPEGGYQYQIEATDPDGDALTYQLLAGPTGMTVGNGGLVNWSPTTAQIGEHRITVATFDSLGLGATQSYSVTVTAANQAPVIRSVPVEQATAGTDYSYDVWASDPDGEAISITLTKAPEGMTIDELGRIRWQPDNLALGTYPIEVVVSDSRGAATTQSYDLVVTMDQTAPQVSLVVSNNNPDLGETITLKVSASDNVGVDTLTLTVNGDAVALDTQGQATVTLERPGVLNAVATATDTAGNEGTDSDTIRVIDVSDVDAPQVDLISLAGDLEFFTPITGPVDIIGNAIDDNLAFYTLSVAVVGSDDFVEIARGNSVVENGVLGQFDPSTLQNDSYRLRLRAEDANGLASTIETQVNVEGELKLGNFQLSFTDMSVPVAGIPIQVTRTYDTLTSNTTDDFGYGWRLEFRDTDLRTSLGRDEQLESIGIGSKGFSEGDKVYITLPGGKRESFTFKPQRHPLSRLSSLVGNVLFRPGFEAETGSTSTLTVKQVDITRLSNGEFANFGGARYNPANNAYGGFGGYYELTTQEGIVYRINATTGDMDTVTDLNGNVLTFTDAGISSSTGQQVTFERDAQNRITAAIDPEGNRVIYDYDANGDLIAVTDRENNTTKFDYNDDRAHYLEEVIDPLERSGVRSEYDEQGRLNKLTDADGKAVVLNYDPDNSLHTVTNQLGYSTTYEYDERGNVVTEFDDDLRVIARRTYDNENNMLTETDPLGNTTTFTYDADGNVLSEKDALDNVTRYTYDSRGNVLTTTDPTGQTITNTYDDKGNLTKIDGQASGSLSFEYDDFGLLRTMTDGSGVTTFTYDRYGNVESQTDALGNTTTFTYDLSGNRETETTMRTLADGTVETLVTQMEYDDEGRVVKTTDPMGYITETIYDAAGNRIEEIDALDRSTKYVYNDRGELIETIYPDATPDDDSDNLRTRTEYDAAGQVIAEIDELGRRTLMVYDKVGRQIATIYPDATPNDNSDNPRTRTEYDIAGRVIAEIDERGNRTEFRHDEVGRVIETILPDETPEDLSDNPHFTTAYDAAGRQLTQTDALDQVTRFLYDDLGRPVGQEYADGTRTGVEYDDAGRVEARIDQNGIRTEYEYDNAGRLEAVIDAEGHRTTYGYDEQGNQVTQTDANGNTTRYEYDKLGRRTATKLPLGQRSISDYDPVGNMISTTDFNGDTKTYTYDERNRLVQKDLPGTEFDETHTYTNNGLRETVTDGRGTTRYRYDEQNRLTERIDPDGRTIAYSYDIAGNRTSVEIPSGTTNYTFDAQNRLKTVTDPDSGVTTYTYNAVGNLERTEFPNGTAETREYDELNRLVYIENSGLNGIINSFRYTLDDTGNRTAVNEHDGRRVVYEYDDLYRLESEIIYEPNSAGPSRIIEYVYDNVGNRLSRTDTGEGTTLYIYDDNDQLKTVTISGVVTNYTYDNNGNTTSKTTDGTTVTYTWNADNRLIGADTDGDDIIDVENRYNENGIRISQTVNGEETRFLVDANRSYAQVLEEYTPSGITKISYVHGNDLISQNGEDQKSVYHIDGLGSTRALSDNDGFVTNQYVYDAFGQNLARIGETENSFLFVGEQRDEKLGLDYLRARYYDPSTGRFTARDAFDGLLLEPSSKQKYSYVRNNPINNYDPSGNVTLGQTLVTASVVGGLSGGVIGGIRGGAQGAVFGALSSAILAPLATAATVGAGLGVAALTGIAASQGIALVGGIAFTGSLAYDFYELFTAKAKRDKVASGVSILFSFGAVGFGAFKFSGIPNLSPHKKGNIGAFLSQNRSLYRGEVIVAREVTVQTSSGRFRADMVTKSLFTGRLRFVESKFGPTAKRTKNQFRTHETFSREGGEIRTDKLQSIGISKGDKVPPSQVLVDQFL